MDEGGKRPSVSCSLRYSLSSGKERSRPFLTPRLCIHWGILPALGLSGGYLGNQTLATNPHPVPATGKKGIELA